MIDFQVVAISYYIYSFVFVHDVLIIKKRISSPLENRVSLLSRYRGSITAKTPPIDELSLSLGPLLAPVPANFFKRDRSRSQTMT
jgi:hypothetical protein